MNSSLPEFRCVWQIHTAGTATTSVRSINLRKGLFYSEITQKEAKAGVFGFMFLWQHRAKTLPLSTKQLWNLILGVCLLVVFFGAHLFVNKKMQWKQRGIRFKPAWNMPSVSQPNPTDSPRGACSSQCGIVRRIWKLWQALPVKPHLMPVDTLLWLGLHLITEQRSTSQQFIFYKLE